MWLYFNEGKSTGHLLAVKARLQQGITHIDAIQTSLGDTVNDHDQIASVFFKDVYTSKVSTTEDALARYLDQCSSLKLTQMT